MIKNKVLFANAVLAIVLIGIGIVIFSNLSRQKIKQEKKLVAEIAWLQSRIQNKDVEIERLKKSCNDKEKLNEVCEELAQYKQKEAAAAASRPADKNIKGIVSKPAVMVDKGIIGFGVPDQEELIGRIEWDKLANLVIMAYGNSENDYYSNNVREDLMEIVKEFSAIRGHTDDEEFIEDPVFMTNIMKAILEQIGAGLNEEQLERLEKICTATELFFIGIEKDKIDGSSPFGERNWRAWMSHSFSEECKALLNDYQKERLKEHNIPLPFLGYRL